MDDFLMLLSFMIIPIAITLLFAVVLPPVGTVLSVRNELLITLSLPSAAAAVLALLALAGIPETMTPLRIALTTLLLLGLYSLLLKGITAPVKRQTALAGILVGSQALTRFSVALKPSLEGEFRELLNGEMLAVSNGDLTAVAITTVLLAAALIRFFPLVRTFALDEQFLLRFPKLLKGISGGTRLASTLLVTLGVVTIGPLLTTALMVLPSLFTDTKKRGFTAVMISATLVGLAGILVGFPVALLADLPPAYVIAVVLVPVGILSRLIR